MQTNYKPATVILELTETQKQQVAKALGVERLMAGPGGEVGIELAVEELEQRILPGINLGN
jgi:hypothetical protein